MKRNTNKLIPFLAGVVIFAFIYIAGLQSQTAISNDGFNLVDVNLDGTTLRFSGNCYTVAMNIHEVQALSIANGVSGQIDVRPLTHDMLKEIIDTFGIRVIEVRVESFENEIWKAKTFLQQGNTILDLDTRPSDAVGIAVRTDAPVYFSTKLLQSRGIKTC